MGVCSPFCFSGLAWPFYSFCFSLLAFGFSLRLPANPAGPLETPSELHFIFTQGENKVRVRSAPYPFAILPFLNMSERLSYTPPCPLLRSALFRAKGVGHIPTPRSALGPRRMQRLLLSGFSFYVEGLLFPFL